MMVNITVSSSGWVKQGVTTILLVNKACVLRSFWYNGCNIRHTSVTTGIPETRNR